MTVPTTLPGLVVALAIDLVYTVFFLTVWIPVFRIFQLLTSIMTSV